MLSSLAKLTKPLFKPSRFKSRKIQTRSFSLQKVENWLSSPNNFLLSEQSFPLEVLKLSTFVGANMIMCHAGVSGIGMICLSGMAFCMLKEKYMLSLVSFVIIYMLLL
jgi:hypothetical protein